MGNGAADFSELISRVRGGSQEAAWELITEYGDLVLRAVRKRLPDDLRRAFDSQDSFSQAIFDRCREVSADLAVLGGFLKRIVIPEDFTNRVTNIHPALIPSFCGDGMYGHHVHEAVLQYGAKLSGCTVHFADNQYDHGPIILQREVTVLPIDTPDSLAARVFEAECKAYPEALQAIADGRVTVEGEKVRIAER